MENIIHKNFQIQSHFYAIVVAAVAAAAASLSSLTHYTNCA